MDTTAVLTEYRPDWPTLAYTGGLGIINPLKGRSTSKTWTRGAIRPYVALEVVVQSVNPDEVADILAEAGLVRVGSMILA